jgi:rubrerythrin
MTAPTVSVVTKDTGGRAAPSEWLFVDPDATLPPEEVGGFLAGSGLNGPVLADMLSEFLAHERCGVHLYRMAANLTINNALKGKYEEFGRETAHHITVLEDLVTRLGGRPRYVSPSARVCESMNAKMLEGVTLACGTLQVLQLENMILQTVFLAECKDQADWQMLVSLVEELPEGEPRQAVADAVAEVAPQEDDHVGWARATWQALNTELIHQQKNIPAS